MYKIINQTFLEWMPAGHTEDPKPICSPLLQSLEGGINNLSCFARKLVFSVSDQVRHKLGRLTEDGYMLEISDLGS